MFELIVNFLLQETLGDIVYAQLPDVDTELEQFGKTSCFLSVVIICLIVFCIEAHRL